MPTSSNEAIVGTYRGRSTRRKYTKRSASGMPRYKSNKQYSASVLQAVVRRQLAKSINKNIETKRGVQTATDGTEILHNNFITLNSTVLQTTLGVFDPTTNSVNNRIGDQINLRGVSIKFMVELNERYSDVTFRLFVVKCAKGDVPTRATLFNGISGNKMIDTINTERYTILKSHTFKVKAPNQGAWGSAVGGGAGAYEAYPPNPTLSRATKIVKVWIPGTKFNKSGIIKYENETSQPKFFDYHVLLYAYSNYSTLQDIWNVGRLNDYVQTIYYKDA